MVLKRMNLLENILLMVSIVCFGWMYEIKIRSEWSNCVGDNLV